jgi:hypothetical protein
VKREDVKREDVKREDVKTWNQSALASMRFTRVPSIHPPGMSQRGYWKSEKSWANRASAATPRMRHAAAGIVAGGAA